MNRLRKRGLRVFTQVSANLTLMVGAISPTRQAYIAWGKVNDFSVLIAEVDRLVRMDQEATPFCGPIGR